MSTATHVPHRRALEQSVEVIAPDAAYRNAPKALQFKAGSRFFDEPTLVLIILALVVGGVGVAVDQFTGQTAVSDSAAQVGRPAETPVTRPLRVELLHLAPAALGKLKWSDDPAALFERTIRFSRVVVDGRRQRAELFVGAPDGQWTRATVGISEPVGDTGMTVARIDDRLVILCDAGDTLHRVFMPQDWPALADTCGFTDVRMPAWLTQLGATSIWGSVTRSRRPMGVHVTMVDGSRIPDDVYLAHIRTIEHFAVECRNALEADPDVDTNALLARCLIERGISRIAVAPAGRARTIE